MSMQAHRKLVAVTGKYTNKEGQEKSQYSNCGTLFQRDDGSFCIKLDSLPLGDFNGWINCYDLEEKRQESYAKGTQQAREAMAPQGKPEHDFTNDSIPF
jgi:hypothetical protein